MTILIRSSRQEHGWMGNMSPHPVRYQNIYYKTAETLFQCLRFTDNDVRYEIMGAESPLKAKMIAKLNSDSMVVKPMTPADIENMRRCLTAKLQQYPELVTKLVATGEEEIIEDVTKRPQGNALFWGAAQQTDNSWKGENWLGKLWMELRSQLILDPQFLEKLPIDT